MDFDKIKYPHEDCNGHHFENDSARSEKKQSYRRVKKDKRFSYNDEQIKNIIHKRNSSFYTNQSKNCDVFEQNFVNKKICAVHSKELDMICQETSCLKAVCSSCILFGDHKNHKYCQIDKFFSKIKQISSNVNQIKQKIDDSKSNFNFLNSSQKIFEKLKIIEERLSQDINNNFDQIIQKIQKQKKDKLNELNFYFKDLKINLEKYSQDYSNKIMNCNSSTENLFSLCFKEESIPENVIPAFEFKKKVEDFKIFANGKKILDSIKKSESILINTMNECLNSIQLKWSHVNDKYLEFKINKINFEIDLFDTFTSVPLLSGWEDLISNHKTIQEESDKKEINLMESNSDDQSHEVSSCDFSKRLNLFQNKIDVNISELNTISDKYSSKSSNSECENKKNDFMSSFMKTKPQNKSSYINPQIKRMDSINSTFFNKTKQSVENIYFTQSKN